jgi:hypothetical protein
MISALGASIFSIFSIAWFISGVFFTYRAIVYNSWEGGSYQLMAFISFLLCVLSILLVFLSVITS